MVLDLFNDVSLPLTDTFVLRAGVSGSHYANEEDSPRVYVFMPGEIKKNYRNLAIIFVWVILLVGLYTKTVRT